MKVGELRSLLGTLSDALGSQEVIGSASALQKFSEALDPLDDKGILALSKPLSRFEEEATIASGPRLSDVVPAVTILCHVVGVVGKAGDANQMGQLLGLFSKYPNVSLSAISDLIKSPGKPKKPQPVAKPKKPPPATEPPNMTLVQNYLARLKLALGKDDEFMPLYRELKNDDAIKKGEMVALADLFMGPVKPSTTRPKALGIILSRHRKIVDFV
jgi:hypothetical protein